MASENSNKDEFKTLHGPASLIYLNRLFTWSGVDKLHIYLSTASRRSCHSACSMT